MFLARLSKDGKRIAKAVHFDTDKRQVKLLLLTSTSCTTVLIPL